jgi:hypothetical protein
VLRIKFSDGRRFSASKSASSPSAKPLVAIEKLNRDVYKMMKIWLKHIVDYIISHVLSFSIYILISMILYLLQYGWTNSISNILEEKIYVASFLAAWITIVILYPIIWFTIVVFINSNIIKYKPFIMSLYGFFAGVIFAIIFNDYESFFDHRYGSFSYIVGFSLGPLIYFLLKNKYNATNTRLAKKP